LVVTRKRAAGEVANGLAEQLQGRVAGPTAVAHLGLAALEGLVSRRRHTPAILRGARIVAASGIGDPEAFTAQLGALGAVVETAAWRDHHAYDDGDIAWLVEAGRRADHVVITAKDAVKLRDRWPSATRAAAPEPLVATLDLEWEQGGERIAAALADVIHSRVSHQPEPL
jgi:tetraacyldisaccharide-1-P 4'-kinase